MESTSSVSKAIFVFKKPHDSTSGRSKKLLPHLSQAWYKAFKQTWDTLERQVKDMYTSVFSQLLNQVAEFLDSCDATPLEIPTALILTGMNLPDHSVLFSSVEKRLKAEVSPHVVLLSARSCPKVRTMIGHIVRQCRQDTSVVTEDEEEEEGDLPSDSKRVVPCSFSELAQWYSNQHDEDKRPIVVILTDFEGFSASVLDDFIYIASEYQSQVPINLVLGVATTISAVHAALPHRAISRLHMQTFITQNSSLLLNQFIEKVLLAQDCNFKIGGKVFTMLSDNFLYYDFSIQGFLQKFKYCMLSHYKRHCIAVANWHLDNINRWVLKMDQSAINHVQGLPSFRAYVEKQGAQEKKALISNNDHFKKVAVELLHKLTEHFSVFLVGLRCLHEMSKDLPNTPMGKHLGDLYYRTISSSVGQSADFRRAEELWRNLSKTGLEIHLRNILHVFRESKVEHEKLAYWTSQLNVFKKKLHDLDVERDECPSPRKSGKVQELSSVTSRLQMQEKLKQIAQTPAELNQFERTRSEILDGLSVMLGGGLTSLLMPPKQLPLHELMLFEETREVVTEQLIGSSRSTLHDALANPGVYLRCECCQILHHGDILPSMPDVCIAYKLHLECGKHINLYDWMQSFHQVVNPDSTQEIDTSTQSRFTQAVAELQFLGFIKPTTRKADHVVRLTYGHG